MRNLFAFVVLLLFALFGCQPIRLFDEVPAIKFESISPGIARENIDTVLIVFSFTDGDGDLGLETGDTTNDITVIDKRNGPPAIGDITFPYRMPYVTPPGQSKQISGTVELKMQNLIRRPGLQTDTVRYEIQIRDRANRLSNTITTPPIVITAP
jgi:hypothetical protein